ncbi:MAG: putative methyltransferase [Oceanicoccus sp.]|jgi:predicted methyltransferase
MHDIYYEDPDIGWVAIDKEKFLSGIYQRLKAGGVFGVIDTNALSGADNALVGKGLHRVDPQAMIDDIIAAGFVFEASSDLLTNSQDDKTASVFSPEIRYRTDRSVLRFRRPKSE